jgi:hypothetical protein
VRLRDVAVDEKHVRRLEVAVHDAGAVRVIERVGDALAEHDRVADR